LHRLSLHRFSSPICATTHHDVDLRLLNFDRLNVRGLDSLHLGQFQEPLLFDLTLHLQHGL
jgi:hypothetical protein